MLDLECLNPAPWTSDGYRVKGPSSDDMEHYTYPCLFEGKHLGGTQADMDFCALARNAFDVMMQRGWHAFRDDRQWIVLTGAFDGFHVGYGIIKAADPFTALVKADKWYKENVEKGVKDERL